MEVTEKIVKMKLQAKIKERAINTRERFQDIIVNETKNLQSNEILVMPKLKSITLF